jgi:hypothetical protein
MDLNILKNQELDQVAWNGIQSLLNNFVQLEKDDEVVICYTPDSRIPASWVALAIRERGNIVNLVYMLPLKDKGFKERISPYFQNDSIKGRKILLMFEKETMSHNQTVKNVLCKLNPELYQVIRMINSGYNNFHHGLLIHPEELSALNATILERCRNSTKLRIKTLAGTDLFVELDNNKFRYMSNRGVGSPGKFLVLPPGEVATFPSKISGKLVADFAINVNMLLEDDVRLDKNPIYLTIENNKLVSYHCTNENVMSFLDKCLKIKNIENVGELGFGTNIGVTYPIPENSHLNERVPGIHLGFGQHNQTVKSAGYECDIHIDLCAKGGVIWFDEDPIPLDLENIPPSKFPHPLLINCEDVFSDDAEDDCCGLLTD